MPRKKKWFPDKELLSWLSTPKERMRTGYTRGQTVCIVMGTQRAVKKKEKNCVGGGGVRVKSLQAFPKNQSPLGLKQKRWVCDVGLGQHVDTIVPFFLKGH